MADKREAVTESRIATVLMRLNEAKRRQITLGHIATHGDIEAAMDLISDMAARLLAERPHADTPWSRKFLSPDQPWSEAANLHWSPLDTEVRD